MKQLVAPALLLCSGLLAACDSGNPVATVPATMPPSGATFTVGLSADPLRVPAGSGMPSTITVTATSTADGQPPADGTLVTLSTDLGNFIDGEGRPAQQVMAQLMSGTAEVNLFPGNEPGTASVLAQVGASVGTLQVIFFESVPGSVFLVSVDPDRGSSNGGTPVTLRGGGFVEPLQVSFGGGAATILAVSADEITLSTPASVMPVEAGQSLVVDIALTNALDQPEPQTANLPGGFTYVADISNVAPQVASVSPGSGTNAGGTQVTILGAFFDDPRVFFGAEEATTVLQESSTRLTVFTPAAGTANADRAVDVTVRNASGLEGTLLGGFTYTASPFFLTRVEPDSGAPQGGETVRILGGGFQEPLRVEFGGKTAAVLSVAGTIITVTAPSSAAPVPAGESLVVDVTVTNALDSAEPPTATLAGGYTYGQPAIIISSISPPRGPYTGGTTVTISGSNLPAAGSTIAIEIAGVRQSAEVARSTTSAEFETVGVGVAMCPESGELPQMGITLTDVATGDMGMAALTFTYLVPSPVINRVSPTFGGQLGNTIVNVEGTDFEDPVRVVFARGGAEFSASVLSQTDVLVRVSTPRVPDSLFDEVDCVFDDGSEDGAPGKRYVQTTVDVQVRNQSTGCADIFGNAFTYSPTNPNCRQVSQ